jgi:hypothetical protein
VIPKFKYFWSPIIASLNQVAEMVIDPTAVPEIGYLDLEDILAELRLLVEDAGSLGLLMQMQTIFSPLWGCKIGAGQ